jgi:hypothetical protein
LLWREDCYGTGEASVFSLIQEGLHAGLSRRDLLRVLKELQKAQLFSRAMVEKLARVERYERRAMSRRRGLVRTLDAPGKEDRVQSREWLELRLA